MYDSESEGFEVKRHRLIQMAAVMIPAEDGRLLEERIEFESFVKIKNPLPLHIENLTGIKSHGKPGSPLTNAPSFSLAFSNLIKSIEDAKLKFNCQDVVMVRSLIFFKINEICNKSEFVVHRLDITFHLTWICSLLSVNGMKSSQRANMRC